MATSHSLVEKSESDRALLLELNEDIPVAKQLKESLKGFSECNPDPSVQDPPNMEDRFNELIELQTVKDAISLLKEEPIASSYMNRLWCQCNLFTYSGAEPIKMYSEATENTTDMVNTYALWLTGPFYNRKLPGSAPEMVQTSTDLGLITPQAGSLLLKSGGFFCVRGSLEIDIESLLPPTHSRPLRLHEFQSENPIEENRTHVELWMILESNIVRNEANEIVSSVKNYRKIFDKKLASGKPAGNNDFENYDMLYNVMEFFDYFEATTGTVISFELQRGKQSERFITFTHELVPGDEAPVVVTRRTDSSIILKPKMNFSYDLDENTFNSNWIEIVQLST